MAVMHANQPLGPVPAGFQTGLPASLGTAVMASVYIHCCLAKWGTY